MTEKLFDLVGLGECLIEFAQDDIGDYRQGFAGDVFNTLFYGSRLGLKTGFITSIGTDDFTPSLLKFMEQEMIDHQLCPRSLQKQNGLYFISHSDPNNPQYSFWRNDSAARSMLKNISIEWLRSYIASSRYFHFSAIALAILEQRNSLIELLRSLEGETHISFDTNYRQGLWENDDALRDFINTANDFIDVLFVSKEDDAMLYGSREAEEAVNFYAQLGYRTIIFRQGGDDVLCYNEGVINRVTVAKDITVIDATGAGDSFNAGFLAAKLINRTALECVSAGNNCAAYVIQHRGGIAQDFNLTI
ncbi:MAG: sugar kinase [bacterium]